MIEVLEQSDNRVIASAVQINGPDAPPLERIRTSLSNAATDQCVTFLPGRNLFLRRETFDRIGGFPEHLVTCEDYYFTDMASRVGKLYYTSDASYIHLGEDKAYSDMFSKEIWRGQSNLLSIKGRRIPLSEIPSFIVPIGLLFLLIMFIIFMLSGYPVIAAICAILFILPVSAYSIRLYRLCKDDVSFSNVLKFYLYYFPARAIGTIVGAFRTLNTKSHYR
jgi:GT2 family glycosyltransferase